MKLHLPVSLRRAVMKVLAALALPLATTVASGATVADSIGKGNLGKTMFVGDSITHGAHADLYSWRWSMHKILVDNGISYEEVGVKTGNTKDLGTDMLYGTKVFQNVHSAQCSARAYEIAERKAAGQFEGTGIQHWLGENEPDAWPEANKNKDGFKLTDEQKPVNTFFMLIGTNDWLSDDVTEQSRVAAKAPDKEKNLIGRTVENGVVKWSGEGDLDTIVSTMFSHNSDASLVLLTVPTWGTHTAANRYTYVKEDYKTVQEYNVHLKEWVEQNKNKASITLVDTNLGLIDVANTEMPGKGVDSFFYSSSDRLHPSTQGELIIAGNVAKQLGIAGRTAGQKRKAGSDFQLQTGDFVSSAEGQNVTVVEETKLQFATSGNYKHDWGDSSPTGGYTVEFKLDGGIGNGATDGWDVKKYFSVSVGSGTTGGTLNIDEAYIRWGDNVLYSLDTSSVNLGEGKWDAIRIAYIMGNPTLGLSTGFYVWLGDQLIGEALGSDSTTEGLSITNSTSGNVTLSELYMDANSWAPTTTLKMVSNPTIAPESPPEYRDFAGEKEWASDGLQPGEIDVSKLKESLESYSGATVSSGTLPTGGLLTEAHRGDIYVTFTGGVKSSTFESFFQNDSASITGDVYLRFLNLDPQSLGTFFVINGSYKYGVEGDMYLEFSSKNLSINSGDFGGYNSISVAAGYDMGCISGTYRMVFNDATLNGDVYGGFVHRTDDSTPNSQFIKVGGVEIYLNGGEFKGNIYAGGWGYGSVGAGDAGDGAKLGRAIIITGDDATFAEGTDKVISLGGRDFTSRPTTVDGNATLTISGVSQSGGIAQFAGTLDGGTAGDYTRSLVITGGTAVAEMKASVTNFDKITVKESSVIGLKLKGTGLTAIEIEAGSELDIAADEANDVQLSNGGATLVLRSGATLSATVAASDEKGTIIVENGGALTLTDGSAAAAAASLDGIALAAEGPSVQQDVILQGGGSYTAGTAQMAGVLVTLDGGGQYTIGANVENAQIRLTLTGMTSDSSIIAGGTYKNYGITLVGSNNIELGDGMKETAFFGTSGALDFEEGATLEIGLSAIMKTLRDGSDPLTYKLAKSSLGAWNSNEKVKIARELDLLGWTATFTAQGELQLTKTATSTPGDLYWDGGSLTWGGAEASQPWKSGSTSGEVASWTDRSSAHLSGGGTITMGGDVIVNDLEFGAGTFTFNGGKSLSVLGNVTRVSNTTQTVGFGQTSVEVLGDFTVIPETNYSTNMTFGKKLDVRGKLTWWGGGILTLSEGGTLGELDPSWNKNAEIQLGGDLVLTKGLYTQNNGKQVTFANSGSKAVYLVFQTGGVVQESTNDSSHRVYDGIRISAINGTYAFNNVGIAAKGKGTILKLLDNIEPQWAVGGNLLAAEQGTLVIDGAHPMVVTGKILANGGTINTTQTTASVSASGLEVTNGGSVSTNGTWTISGAVTLDATSTLTIQGGKLDLTGAEAAPSLSGHLVLDGGELSTSAQGLTIKELRVASGGKLTINGDTSIESLTSSQSLTSLTIAEGKSLSLQSGTLKLGREFSWGEGSTLKLTGANVVLDATDLILFGESDSSVGNLTIDLSTAFLEGIEGSNQRRLFSSRWDSSWTDKITLTVDGKTPTGDYEGLHISSDGKLVWNEETDQLFWGKGDGAHTSLTLGTGEQTWGAEKGSDTGATWSGTPSVSLEATSGTVTVNVGEGATMKNFSTADVSGDSNVTYNLTATDAKTATVNGTLSVGSKTTLSVGNNVTLDVKGTYSGTGTLKLEGGNVSFGSTEGTTITNVTLAASANSDVTLKGNLTVEVLTGDNWDNPSDLTIKNATETSVSPLTFTVDSENEKGNNLWSAFTLGGPTARIDLIKTGTGMQSLGVGKIEIFGDVTVSAGTLRITAASAGSIIHGKVSGSGQLRLASNTSITIEGKDGDAGSIGTLNCYAASNSSPTLYLGGDLTFKEVLSDGDDNSHGSLTLNRATGTQGVNNAPEVVYLLWDSTGQSEGLSWSDYIDKFGTIKHGSNEEGFAGDTGYGKAGNNELTISGAATIDGNFKVKEGTMTFSEAATLTANRHIVVGDSAKLNFSGGIDGGAGTLTSLTLGNGAGVELASGTLKSKALTLSGSATLTLKVASGGGANLDLGGITFSGDENTKLTIKLNGWDSVSTDGYQLFDISQGSQWSTAKAAILGLFSRFVFQDGNGTAIGDVKLTEEGRLVLSEPTPTVDTYTWDGTGSVTLGDRIDVQGNWNDTGVVDNTKTVVLNGTGDAVTVTVSGSEEQDPEVNVKALTVGDTAGGTAAYTFSGTSNQKLTVKETLTLNTPSTFESTVSVTAKQLVVDAGESGAVNFAGGLTLTNGTTAGGLTITKGNVTFSGGTVDIGAGSVLGLHSTIGNGASLTVEAGVQLKSLGVTELKEGATLTLKTLGTKGEGWNANGGNSIVWGDGTLIFDGITATSAADFNDGFLPGGESYTLGELRLSGSRIATNSTRFQHVTKMVVGSDSTLELTADIFTTTAHPEVHISGTGYSEVGAALVYTPASDEKAGRQDHTHIVLDANATISNAGTIWFMGSLSALQHNGVDGVERHTLTKTGGGFFQVLATSTVTNVDFDVAGGRLLINQDNADENGIHSTTVTLSGGHLKVGGGGENDTTTLTLKALEGTTENSSIYAGSYNSKVFTLTLSDDTAKAEHSVVADLGYGSDTAVGADAAASHAFNLTKTGQATQKFEGKVNLGNIDVQGGKLEFALTAEGTAGAVSVATSSELAVGDNKLTISGLSGQGSVTGDGTLKLTAGTGSFEGTFSANLEYAGEAEEDTAQFSLKSFTGKELTVTSGELTLGTAEGATLSKLALGAGEIAGKLTVSDGSFTLNGELSWVSGSVLTLGAAGQTITLGEGASIFSGASTSGKLTINLTETFMEGEATGKGSVQLFGDSVDQNWIDNLTFTVDGTPSSDTHYKNLKLRSDGYLTWGDVTDLYWPGTSEDKAILTWGTGGGKEWSTSTGRTGDEEWVPSANVHLGATGDASVTLKDETITAGSITFTAVNKNETGYTFRSGAEGGSTTLVVEGDITNTVDGSSVGVKATFDNTVTVDVKNFISKGTDGKDQELGDFTFNKKLTVKGLLQFWGGSLQLDEGGDVGTLDASWNNGTIKLGGDLKVGNWFFEGADPGGHKVKFEKTGSAKEVFIEVGRVVRGDAGQQSQAGTLGETSLTINGGGGVMSIGEGIGIKKSSSGTLTFGGTQTFVVGGSFAAVNGGSMVFNVNAEAKMNVEVGENSTITIGDKKTLTTSGLMGWQGDGGMTYGTITGEGTLKVSTDSTEAQEFGGTISSNLEYEGKGVGSSLTLTQAFGGESLRLSAGTLKLAAGGTVTSLNGSDGALEVGGTMEVGSVTGNLTKLTLGAGSTVHVGGTVAQTLTVGGLTWGKGAKLDIDSQLTIGLSAVTLATPAENGLLTIDLSSTVLDNLGSGSWQLFSDWSQVADWKQYIEFKVDGNDADSDTYGDLGLDKEGKLTWVDNSNNYVWTGEDGTVTLGDSISDGRDLGWNRDSGDVDNTKTVVLKGTGDGGTVEVTVGGGDDSIVNVKALTVGEETPSSATKYTFNGESQTLTVAETLTLNTSADFRSGLTVSAKQLVVNAGDITFKNGLTLTNGITATGISLNGGSITFSGGTVNMGDGDITNTQGVDIVSGTVTIGKNVTATNLGFVRLGEGGTLVLETIPTTAHPVYGVSLGDGQGHSGKLVYKGLEGELACGFLPGATYGLGELELDASTLQFNGTSTSNNGNLKNVLAITLKNNSKLTLHCLNTFFVSGQLINVESGSSIEISGNEKANTSYAVFALGQDVHLVGSGSDGAGALIFSATDTNSPNTWADLILDEDATVSVTGDDLKFYSLLSSADENTRTFTKKGASKLIFAGENTSNTYRGSFGEHVAFDIQEGTIVLSTNSGAATEQIYTLKEKLSSAKGASLELDATAIATTTDRTVTLNLSGDTSEFKGTLAVKERTTLNLSSGTDFAGTLDLESGGTVAVTGGTEKNMTIATLAGTGGALNVTGMVSIGASTHTGLTSLTLAKDSKLDLTALASMNLGAVTVTDTATIAVGRDASRITELTVDSLTGNLTIDLTGVNKKNLDGLQLFSGGIDFAEQVSLTGVKLGSRDELWLDAESGQLRFTTIEAPITWDGTGSDELTWKENGGTNEWTIGEGETHTDFMYGDTVLFTDGGAGANTVTLDATDATTPGKLEAASVTVEDGTWTFEGDELVVDEALEVGGTATFKNTTNAKTLTGSGSVTLSDGGSLTIQDTLTTDAESGFTGGITLDNGTLNLGGEGNTLGKKLTLGAGGGTINGSITAELDGQNADAKLTLGTGTQNLSGTTKGEVNVGGTLTGNKLTVGGLSGSGTLDGSVTVDGVGGTFEGTVAEPLELTVESGTQSFSKNAKLSAVALNGGTLNLAAGGTVTSLNGAGGALEVGGTVEVGSVTGSLTKLTLGDGATMHVGGTEAQTLGITGGFTWGKDATLELDSQLTIALAEGALTQPGEGGQLTIDLSSDVLNRLGSGNWQLFDGWSGEDWTQYFTFTIDGQAVDADRYGEFGLDADGRLTWKEPLHSDLYWDASNDDDGSLTWEGKDKEWSTAEGGAPNTAWPSEEGATDGTSVHIAGEEGTPYEAQMEGDVTAKSVEFNGGDYTFAEEEEVGTLTTSGDLTVGKDKKTTVDFGNKDLDVGGNLSTGDGSTLATTGGATVQGDLTVGKDGEATVGGALDVGGNLTTGEGGTLTSGGDTTVQRDFSVGKKGEATVGGMLSVGGKLSMDEGGKLDAADSAIVQGDFSVGKDGEAKVGGLQLYVGGKLTTDENSTLTTEGDATVQGDFSVGKKGEATVGGVLDVFGNLATGEGSTLTAEGSAIVQGNFSIGKDSEATVVGMLNVDGDLSTGEGGKLTTAGDTSVAGGVTLGSGSLTATGKLDVTGDVNVGSGSLTATGGGTWGSAQVGSKGSLTMKDTTVNGGVTMKDGSSVTMEGSTVNGQLSVEGGKLTVRGESTLGSMNGRLTELEIADEGKLTVNGTGWAADTLTWGSGSTLGIGSGFSGTLDFGAMGSDGNLTLDLSSQFLDQLGTDKNSVELFKNWEKSWGDKLELTINGRKPEDFRDGYYDNLHIGDDGTLTWSTKGKSFYESSTDNDTADDGTKTEWSKQREDDNIYDSVGDYGQVIVDSNTNIDFSKANVEDSKGKEQWREDGLTVHNLNGTNSNAKLTITGGKDNNKVTLKNSYSSEKSGYGDDLTYSGGVTVEKAELHINHEDTNPASLHHGAEWGTVMGGELDLSQGQGLFMDRGVLELQNEANQLTDVTFTNDRDGQLVVNGGSATVSGDIILGSGEAVYTKDKDGDAVNRNHVHLENGGVLELVGGDGKKKKETTVDAGVFIGGDDASGSAVGMKGKVSMKKGSKLSGLHLILEDEDTVLTVGKDNPVLAEGPEGVPGTPEGGLDAGADTTFSIYGIQSNGGHLTGNENMNITVQGWDHVFTGSMEGYVGKMTFEEGWQNQLNRLFNPGAQSPQQYFTQVTCGSSDWDMEVRSGARVTLDVRSSKGNNAGWEMGNVTLASCSQTTLGFTFSGGSTGMTFRSFLVAKDAQLTLQAYGSALPTGERFVLGVVDGGTVDLQWEDGSEAAATAETGEDVNPGSDVLELDSEQLVGSAWLHVESAWIERDGNQIVLGVKKAETNNLASAVQGIHRNATEGANALWDLTDTDRNPKAQEAFNDPNSDTSKLITEARRLLGTGNKSELAKLLTAAVGAGYTGYSAALGEDMHRQLTAIRNRTTSMGDEAAAGRNDDMPYWHAWLNAESSYRELDADDLAPGYRVNGWGGTFGVDADVSRNTTVGLALTAMYNDLKCTGADSISGDMDTMYATAFLRHMRGRWMHTLVLSGGTADFNTHRTVMSGNGSYTADADTNGYSLGALYEIGYTTVLSKDSRSVMQYVFNVEARYNSIDGFTESGSDAGLVVDDMDSMTLTFGVGARLQSLFGGKVYNRSALFEARFLVKADAGDRRGEAATHFINGSYTTNMVGAEVGAVGVELGAGITVPVGSSPSAGSFFIDGSLEFRQGWTSFDATLGYRISF